MIGRRVGVGRCDGWGSRGQAEALEDGPGRLGGVNRREHAHRALARRALEQQQRILHRLSPKTHIDSQRQQTDDLAHRANRALAGILSLHHSRLAGLQARLGSLSPLATLERGYAVVQMQETGLVVHSVDQVTDGDELSIRVQDGKFEAVTRSET